MQTCAKCGRKARGFEEACSGCGSALMAATVSDQGELPPTRESDLQHRSDPDHLSI